MSNIQSELTHVKNQIKNRNTDTSWFVRAHYSGKFTKLCSFFFHLSIHQMIYIKTLKYFFRHYLFIPLNYLNLCVFYYQTEIQARPSHAKVSVDLLVDLRNAIDDLSGHQIVLACFCFSRSMVFPRIYSRNASSFQCICTVNLAFQNHISNANATSMNWLINQTKWKKWTGWWESSDMQTDVSITLTFHFQNSRQTPK